ncbi:MAG: hypothetical protein MPJ50_12140, partial [Pirellulales bacterium]|nr:hypothetical protein [Pirellulales bacterium]
PRSGEEGTDLHLSLGDMFFRRDGEGSLKEVLIVLNAACDLAYSPKSNRSFPADRYVLFEYGRLQPIDDDPDSASMCTQPFLHPDDGCVYRINWTHQKAIWKKYSECGEWLEAEHYDRKTRLALPYALELQKSFANHITRIGMPVQPPMARWRSVAICCAKDDGKWSELEVVRNGVQLIHKRTGEEQYTEHFVLSKSTILALVRSADRVQATLDDPEADLVAAIETAKAAVEADGLSPEDLKGANNQLKKLEGQLTGLHTRRRKIQQIGEAHKEWLASVESPRSLPRTGARVEIDARLLWVYLAADYTSNFGSGPPIALNILELAPTEVELPKEA